jgi:hypothetical protein
MRTLNRTRRAVLSALLVLTGAASACGRAAPEPVVTVYRSPTCGCCSDWADHMKANGFRVEEVVRADLASIRAEHGVPPALTSCHTATVAGYTVEGHVPADVVRRLLAERPSFLGVAVPGMPLGSPGMEQGFAHESYEVISFDRNGGRAVYEFR